MFPASRRNDHVMKLELWRRNEGCLGRLLSQVLFGRSAAFEVPTNLNRDSASAVAPGRGRVSQLRPAEGFWQGRPNQEMGPFEMCHDVPLCIEKVRRWRRRTRRRRRTTSGLPFGRCFSASCWGSAPALLAPPLALQTWSAALSSLSETKSAPPPKSPFPPPYPCATRPGMARVSSWQIASAPGQRPMPRKPRTDCECLQERLPQVQRVTQAATMPCSLTRS